MDDHDEDEFGMGSSDDDDFLAAELDVAPNLKRKTPPSDDEPAAKRSANGYPTTCAAAVTILKDVFKMDAFRLKQEAVISRILHGGSAVVVFPTGGGKSLCYQVPALVFEDMDKSVEDRGEGEGGITLVVSPLIALMKDQVDALLKRGVKAAVLDSTRTREQYLETMESLRAGTLKLLYCAPERLNNEGFVESMKYVRGGIRLVAIDEAHCISEWGHAFRPDYLKVARFVKEVKAERVVCLTATATPKVAKDIRNQFDIDETGLFRTSSYRSNLQLLAESASTKQELYPKLFSFLTKNPGPTIIYVTLQKQTEALALDLRRKGFKAQSFHAGMATAEKMRIQDDFMAKDNLIIVATIAFGMGIDKYNIRNVIHFNIPSSLESYSQEIGRAGRDGLTSKCLFYVCGEDLHLREVFARGDLPSREGVKGLLHEIFNFTNRALPIGATIQASQYDQSKTWDIRATTLGNIYAQLELRFELLRAITPIYTKYSYTAGPRFGMFHADTSPVAAAIRQCEERATKLTHIDATETAKRTFVPRADIVKKLNDWNDMQVITLKTAGVLHVYRVLSKLPQTNAEIDALAKEVFAQLEEREQKDLKRTDEMLSLITGSSCFSRVLAEHFGDTIAGGKKDCGHCTWCLTKRPIPLAKPPPKSFDMVAFNKILEAVPDRDDARFLAKIAFGISSPKITAAKLGGQNPLFGSMDDHPFEGILTRFTTVCNKVAQGVLPMPSSSPSSPVAQKKTAAKKTPAKKSTSKVTSRVAPRKSPWG